MSEATRKLKLVGTDLEFNIEKAVAIKADIPTVLNLERLPNGNYKLLFNNKVIPDFAAVQSIEVVREG